ARRRLPRLRRSRLHHRPDPRRRRRFHRLMRSRPMTEKTPNAILLNPQVVVEPGDYRDLYDARPDVRRAFGEASEVLGTDLAADFFAESRDRINSGRVVRPASLAIATALYRAVAARREPPAYIAGLSLGSIIAGHLGGHMSFRDAGRMTHLMPVIEDEEFAGPRLGVAGSYGTDMERVRRARRDVTSAGRVLSPCAYTAADQIILTGEPSALKAMNLRAPSCGGVGLVIPYGPPAHSPLPVLRRVEERFRREWRYLDPPRDPDVPLICNVTARPLRTPA